MKTYKKIALITLLTGIFQLQAINLSDITNIIQDHPKTTALVAGIYAMGIGFNYWKTNPTKGTVVAMDGTNFHCNMYVIGHVYNTDYSLTQKIGRISLPFVYGLINSAPPMPRHLHLIQIERFKKDYPNFTLERTNQFYHEPLDKINS